MILQDLTPELRDTGVAESAESDVSDSADIAQ